MASLRVRNLVCDGNSITAGLINDGGGSAGQNAWPVVCRDSLIADADPLKAWRVAVTAQAGNTTQNRIDKWGDPGGVRSQLMPQLGLNVLTFFEGTNDFITGGLSVDQVIALTTTYAQRALFEGWMLQLCTVPDTTNAGARPKVALLNDWLLSSKTAKALSSFPCLDIATPLGVAVAGTTNWQNDGVHPTAVGYGVIAGVIKARIAAL